MKQMTSCAGLILMTMVMQLAIVGFHCVESKTTSTYALKTNQSSSVFENQSRKFDNFVDFTDEGDQLAIESTGAVAAVDNKKDISGTKASASTTGRQCANVQKAVYPVIPVIIAALVGLIGSIIISAIVRLVLKQKNESHDSGYETSSEYGLPTYGRRVGKWNLFGYDMNNVNFASLVKNVFSAIEKVY